MIFILRKIISNVIAVINSVVILLMIITGYSGYANPESFPFVSTWSLVFPFFLLANIVFFLLWLFINKKKMLLPLAGLLLCIGPIRSYCPLNIPKSTPDDAIKILTYNTWSFGHLTDEDFPDIPILKYIKDCDADIVCLQESAKPSIAIDSVKSTLSQYDYVGTLDDGEPADNDLIVFSKYPIKKKYTIPIESKGNSACAFWLDINGEEVILINVHLESYNLSKEDKDGYVDMLKDIKDRNIDKDSIKSESLFLSRKLSAVNAIRAKQTHVLLDFIKKNKDANIILCGDFNDNPLSYTNHLLGEELTNCYVSSGNGPGWSFNEKGFNFRIDNIYCSKNLQAYGAKVDNEATGSDHYPLYCWLKKKQKQ